MLDDNDDDDDVVCTDDEERGKEREGEGGREKPAAKKKRIESTNKAENSDDANISNDKDNKIISATASDGHKHNTEVEAVKVAETKSKLADKSEDKLSYRDWFS